MTVSLIGGNDAQRLMQAALQLGANALTASARSLLINSTTAGRRGWIRLHLTLRGAGRSRITVSVQLWRKGRLGRHAKRVIVLYGRPAHVLALGPGRRGVAIRSSGAALRRLHAHPHAYRFRVTVTSSSAGAKPHTRRFWISGQALRRLRRLG